jgi:hypothetical protein
MTQALASANVPTQPQTHPCPSWCQTHSSQDWGDGITAMRHDRTVANIALPRRCWVEDRDGLLELVARLERLDFTGEAPGKELIRWEITSEGKAVALTNLLPAEAEAIARGLADAASLLAR